MLFDVLFLLCVGVAEVGTVRTENSATASGRNWERILAETDQLHVLTTFLKETPSEFVNWNSTICRPTPRSTTLASIE